MLVRFCADVRHGSDVNTEGETVRENEVAGPGPRGRWTALFAGAQV